MVGREADPEDIPDVPATREWSVPDRDGSGPGWFGSVPDPEQPGPRSVNSSV